MKLLLATDNHVGYLERDPIRGKDSFRAFEEILQIANEKKVDMILLGGDLFHDNKPSRYCMYTIMQQIRHYCMGSSDSDLMLVSDPNFQRSHTVNYLDPNYNVKIPIFSIHGNHDDPSGDGNLCGLDLLSVAGLVNYFGKQSKIDDMIVKPVLFQKNENKLALYGIGNVRDERLHRTFKQKKCRFERPSENPDDWFNLFVIHQNRTAHSSTNYIPSDYIDNFFHLVLWGHEHECLIDPDQVSEDSFYITQPGSSVATSLCEGEAKTKHVAILTINGQDFEFEKVRLKTIRPFIIDSIILGAVPNLNPSDSKAVKNYLHTKVLEMIETVKSDWWRHNTGDMPKPLVRLKVEYTGGYGTFNPQQFGQNYVDLVANPADILLFYRKKKYAGKGKKSQPNIDVDFEFIPDKLNDKNLQDFITEILCHNELQLLPENEFGSSIQAFVEKQEPNAIADFVNNTKTQAEKTIQSKDTVDYENVERLRDQVVIIKQERAERFASAMALDETKAKKAKTTVVAREASVDEERVYESPDNNYYNEPQSENDDEGFEDKAVYPTKGSKPIRAPIKNTTTTRKSVAKKPVELNMPNVYDLTQAEASEQSFNSAQTTISRKRTQKQAPADFLELVKRKRK